MSRSLSIGVKLTAWYAFCMAGALCALSFLAFLGMRTSIHSTVDEQLRDRMNSVRDAIDSAMSRGNADVLRQELDEDSELRPQSDLLQVWDDQGNVLYQSVPLRKNGLPHPRSVSGASTLWMDGTPIRILESSLEVNKRLYHVQVATRMEEFYEALGRFLQNLLIFAPLALLIASAAGYWISRRALAPVDHIILAAQQISANNLSARLEVPGSGDELQRLTETLNQMLKRIEQSLERITRFSADASHELRTPITVMRTRVELALRRPRTAAENSQTLEQLHTELIQTSELLDNLMLLARADSDAEQLRLVPADIHQALTDVLAQVSPIAEEKQIELHAALPEYPVWIAGDPQLLRRLFLILIDNAVKYTPASGQVSIALEAEDGLITVSITDTGIGISDQDLPHVFDRFYRADKARSREMGGSGLGLSIGKWIAEAHKGSVTAESKYGRGSTFKVALPNTRN